MKTQFDTDFEYDEWLDKKMEKEIIDNYFINEVDIY